MRKKKYAGNVEAVKEACDEFNIAFEEIKHNVFDYARTQKSIRKLVDDGTSYVEIFNEDSSFIFDKILNDVTLLSVLSSPYHINACLNNYMYASTHPSYKILKNLKRIPSFFSVFSIEEIFNDDLYTICDVYTEQKSLLYSPSLTIRRAGLPLSSSLFYSILVNNGYCLQSIGYVFSTFLRRSDFLFLITFFSSVPLNSLTNEKVTKVILENYFRFSLIFLIYPYPYDKVGIYEKGYLFSIHKMKQNCTTLLEENEYLSKISTTNQVDVYLIRRIPHALETQFYKKFPHRNSYFDDMNDKELSKSLTPRLFYHKKNHSFLIEAFTIEGYYLMRIFIESFMGLHFSAQSTGSTKYSTLNHFHDSIFLLFQDFLPHKHLPWFPFLDPFNRQYEKMLSDEKKRVKNEELEISEDDEIFSRAIITLSRLFKEKKKPRKKRRRVDSTQLELFSPEEVNLSQSPIESQSVQTIPSTQVNLPFIHQFPLEKALIINIEIRKHLVSSLSENKIFYILQKSDEVLGPKGLDVLKVLSNEMLKDLVSKYDFPQAMEHLSLYFNENISDKIFNTIIYIMYLYAHEWVSVSALCLTLLMNFKILILNYYESSKEIEKDISQFIYSSLCATGILQINGRVKREDREKGLYAVKTTELFDNIFIFNEELLST